MHVRRIDLNADLGESFGAWKMGADAELLQVVSSCNIACGFHAGDPLTMQRTVAAALANGVAIGAHPSLPDLVGFGRREMQIAADELGALVLYQVAALMGFCAARGARLHHVKAHGALYGMLARDRKLADAFCDAVYALDPMLLVYGPPQGELRAICAARGVGYVAEGFTDRGYLPDASLMPRSQPGALLDHDQALAQGVRIASGEAISVSGPGDEELPDELRTHATLSLAVSSICVHGDGPHALGLARALRAALAAADIVVAAP